MRVLVAEDDRGLRDVLARGLREKGYVVDPVADGQAAIQFLRSYDYAVVILDWRMPELSGLEVLQWMRRRESPAAVLMLTARDAPADRVTGLDQGADDYLVKPFDFNELLARMRALQRRPRSVQAPKLVIGDLCLDPATREVQVGTQRPALTATADGGVEPAWISAPPEWIDRLAGVLVDNACRYAGSGGKVRISVGHRASRVTLTVEDSGPGIPAADRPRLFDRFHRATAQGGGAGLGLAIADSIVRSTAGQWRIGDSPLGGALFGISWRRATVRQAAVRLTTGR